MRTARAGMGKLEAYERASGRSVDVSRDEGVLYLGAAEGKRAANLAERVPESYVVAVEKSPLAALGLVERAQAHSNLVPYVGDARRPASYGPLVPEVGLLFQDIAQGDQVEIFLANVRGFSPRVAYLAVKARSIAVDRPPEDVFDDARQRIEEHAKVHDLVDLEPYHEDHAMIVAEPEGA